MVLVIVTNVLVARSAAPFWCKAPAPLNVIFCCYFNSSSINYKELKIPLSVCYPLITTTWLWASLSKSSFDLVVSVALIDTWGMVNKDTSSWEQIRLIWFPVFVAEPNWIPRDIMIFRHHMYWQNMILLDLLLLHRILPGFIYFIGSTTTLYKLTGSTFGPSTLGHCLGIYLHLQTPCMY